MKRLFFAVTVVTLAWAGAGHGQTTLEWPLKKYPDIAYRERGLQLLWFLEQDVRAANKFSLVSPPGKELHRRVDALCQELYEAGVFRTLDKPLRRDRVERLSPAARAFYEYYRVAQKGNPVFENLGKPLRGSKVELYAAYRAHQSVGWPDAERRAYEAATEALIDGLPSEHASVSWIIAAGSGVAAFATLGVVVHVRRRARQGKARVATPAAGKSS